MIPSLRSCCLLLLILVPDLRALPTRADSLDRLQASLANPRYTERAPVYALTLQWPGLRLELQNGSFRRMKLAGADGDLWLLRFQGSARVFANPADSLEARILENSDGPEWQQKRLRNFLMVRRELPPELAALEWKPLARGVFPALKRWLGNDDAAAMARVPVPDLVGDFLHARDTGISPVWLQFRRPRLWVRCVAESADGPASTRVHRPLHLGSSLYRPLAELACALPPAGHGLEFPAPPQGDNLQLDSLVLDVDIDTDMGAAFRAVFHGRLAHPAQLITVCLDPAVDSDSVQCNLGPLEVWRPRTIGLDAPGSPFIHLLARRMLPADSALVIEFMGKVPLSLATRITTHGLEWPLRAWHPRPLTADGRPTRTRLQLIHHGPQRLQLADGRVIPAGTLAEPVFLDAILDYNRLPVLHPLPRRELQAGEGIRVYLPDENVNLDPPDTGTSFWRYEKETLLDSVRPFRPANPAHAEEEPLSDRPPMAASPGVSGDAVLTDLAPLAAALEALLFPLENPPVLLGEWSPRNSTEDRLRDATYAPEADLLSGVLPASALLSAGDVASLERARALASSWWGGRVSLAGHSPDWLIDGLRIASALSALELVHGVDAANRLRNMAHARLRSIGRNGSGTNLALPMLGARAGGGWQDPDTREALAWRFVFLLENLRHATRDPESLADTRYRRFLRDLCYNLQAGFVDEALLAEKLAQHLGHWAGERLVAFLSSPGPERLQARVQAGDGSLLVQLARRIPGDALTVPLLLRHLDGDETLYFLELTDTDQHFVIEVTPDSLAGFRLDPWHSLDLEVTE